MHHAQTFIRSHRNSPNFGATFLWTAPPPSQPPYRYGSNWGQSDKNRQKTAIFSLGTIIFDILTLQNRTSTICKAPHKSDKQQIPSNLTQGVTNGVGFLTRAWRTRLPCKFHFFAFTTFTEATAKRLFFAWKIEVKTMDARHRFTNDVKSCPKESRYKLTHCDLQRFLWRLWKRKDENSCYARARKDQNEGILAFYTLHPAHCHQLCFVTSPSVPKEVAHNEKIALEISPKTLDFFPKNSHVSLFFSYVFPTLSEKKWCSTLPNGKSKDDNRIPKITAQNIQSARKDTFFGDYLKFYLCMPIKIYNFAK